MIIMMMIIMMMMIMMMMTSQWLGRPRGGERTQRDPALKLIAIQLAEIQNWGRW